MPLKFTTAVFFPFNGPNQNPLAQGFNVVGGGLPTTDQLEILNGACTTTIEVQDDGQGVLTSYDAPDDQWCEVSLLKLRTGLTAVSIYVRAAADLSSGYVLSIAGPFGDASGVSTLNTFNLATNYTWANFLPFTFNKGDRIRSAVVGTTWYILVNDQIVSVADLTADSGGVTTSGQLGLQCDADESGPTINDVAVISFVGGSVAEEETMPAFMSSPFSQRVAMLPGIPFYSFGSFDDRTPPSRLQITGVAITTDVATVNVKLLEGLIPLPGALISIEGTQSLGGAFNVTNVALASVSINTTTGIGTVTFALTHADFATATDSGVALVPQAEVADIFADGSGLQGAVPFQSGLEDSGKTISWWYNVGGSPSTGTVALQGADIDEDAYYETIDSIDASMTQQGTRNVSPPQNFNFLRINVSNASGGTNPTIIAGFEI
jgi:hypothetical protein